MTRTGAALVLTLGLLAASSPASAHPAPSSEVALDYGPQAVRAEMLLPVSELSYAVPGAEPDEVTLTRYLSRHVSAETPAGVPWSVAIGGIRRQARDGHEYVSATLDLTPPPGASVGELVFVDDAITHEVRNHYVVVVARDETDPAGAAPAVVGILQYPASRLALHRAPGARRLPLLVEVLGPAALLVLGVAWTHRKRRSGGHVAREAAR